MTAARHAALAMLGPVLVVDDDRDMCRVLELALTSSGCPVTTAARAREALALAAGTAFAIAFVDARLPDMDGWRLIEELRRLRPAARIVMVSGFHFADDLRVAEALRAGIIDRFLPKPCDIDAIVDEARRQTGNGAPAEAGDDARPSPVKPAKCGRNFALRY